MFCNSYINSIVFIEYWALNVISPVRSLDQALEKNIYISGQNLDIILNKLHDKAVPVTIDVDPDPVAPVVVWVEIVVPKQDKN